ncbi:antibiotic biosynthesis monooxygenase [Stigmatella sp. ncwal1]|uniref:Antibiotic biosynthesis monooxygenase n=1 Tax=Stigmatella ashevillensis TaxID=2995309 RepID=A0ABT5D5D3_9BACT|nr:antibiotic biosynthesis monooxygenase [Stigmatella ashevillena]MDC0708343.1 antibiotic biosynthesis monooxygenase [Stigmatella ashevillena]
MSIAKTPPPPYVAVIFTSVRTAVDEGYAQTSEEMTAMAEGQPGFLGVESNRGADGLGITVSYWRDMDSVRAWKAVAEHRMAQKLGRERWYRAYCTRVAVVEREYGFSV